MIYQFTCDVCGRLVERQARPFHPPQRVKCACSAWMRRIYACQIDTSGCRDADDIPEGQRVAYGGEANITKGQALAVEAQQQRRVDQTRKDIADGGNKASFKMSHQIPAHLYHGKIKQTGDRHYWDDPKNLNRHKSCKVD